ncbi:MAG: CopG family transcriptional regulator [Bacteroidota bacterium]
MLTVRLSDESEKRLADYAELNKIPKSQVVKEALEVYFAAKRDHSDPFALGEDLFGAEGSGTLDGSTSYKSRLKAKLSEKYTS